MDMFAIEKKFQVSNFFNQLVSVSMHLIYIVLQVVIYLLLYTQPAIYKAELYLSLS